MCTGAHMSRASSAGDLFQPLQGFRLLLPTAYPPRPRGSQLGWTSSGDRRRGGLGHVPDASVGRRRRSEVVGDDTIQGEAAMSIQLLCSNRVLSQSVRIIAFYAVSVTTPI